MLVSKEYEHFHGTKLCKISCLSSGRIFTFNPFKDASRRNTWTTESLPETEVSLGFYGKFCKFQNEGFPFCLKIGKKKTSKRREHSRMSELLITKSYYAKPSPFSSENNILQIILIYVQHDWGIYTGKYRWWLMQSSRRASSSLGLTNVPSQATDIVILA